LKSNSGSSVGLFLHCSFSHYKVWPLWCNAWEPFRLGWSFDEALHISPASESAWWSSWIFQILWSIRWRDINRLHIVLGEKLTKYRADADHIIILFTPLRCDSQARWGVHSLSPTKSSLSLVSELFRGTRTSNSPHWSRKFTNILHRPEFWIWRNHRLRLVTSEALNGVGWI
jgi:hypothetical protein